MMPSPPSLAPSHIMIQWDKQIPTIISSSITSVQLTDKGHIMPLLCDHFLGHL